MCFIVSVSEVFIQQERKDKKQTTLGKEIFHSLIAKDYISHRMLTIFYFQFCFANREETDAV